MAKNDTSDAPQLLGEISQAPNSFEQFLERNQKSLLVLAILAALAGGGWVIYHRVQVGKAEDAATALVKADDLSSLQAISKQFPETPAAGSAIVLSAEKQWAENQQDAAIETLRQFIQSKPQHPGVPGAQASLGAKLMAQGKTAEAAAAFQAVVDNKAGRYLAPYALIQLGDMAKLAGDTEKARGYYEHAQNDYPGSNFNMLATQGITDLKAKPPVAIAAPPEKPVDPASDLKSGLDKLGNGSPFGGGVDPDGEAPAFQPGPAPLLPPGSSPAPSPSPAPAPVPAPVQPPAAPANPATPPAEPAVPAK